MFGTAPYFLLRTFKNFLFSRIKKGSIPYMCGLQIVISMITAQIVFALFRRKMRIINTFLRVERSSWII